MANKFVWSGATGANDGSSWENAYVSLDRDWGAEAGFTASTDFVYVRSTHAETATTDVFTLTGASSVAAANYPVRIICVVGADTGTTPGALATGASVTRTTSGDIAINEKLYIYGIAFISNDQLGIASGTTSCDVRLNRCRLELTASDGTDNIVISNPGNNSNRVELIDTVVDFAHVGQGFSLRACTFIWDNGGLAEDTLACEFNVTALLENLSEPTAVVIWRNLDLSNLTGAILGGGTACHGVVISLENCELGSGQVLWSSVPLGAGSMALMVHCQVGTDADPAYQMRYEDRNGTIEVDTARYRTGGASDGVRTNPYSWNMDTTSYVASELYDHLESPPIAIWSPGDGSTAHTYRIFVASGATLQDDEVWVELTGPNDAAANSKGVRKSSRTAILGTPANLTTDSASTWTGADVGTKQQIDITYTPDKQGIVTARIYLAKPTQRVSVDPQIYIDP